ncbi:MAG: CPXCG motif-containing cysteine-rich protein [Arenicella sp.]
MKGLENTSIQCPYCWEVFETVVDYSGIEPCGEAHIYTEDCYVCCRPIVLTVSLDQQGESLIQIDAELT